jgi:Rad3-related DNA helicase
MVSVGFTEGKSVVMISATVVSFDDFPFKMTFRE